MKFRYFFPILVAVVAMFVGCTSDDDPIYLGNIQVSSSYVTFDKEGTPADITLTAAGDWRIDETSVPDWLTISPVSGGAGEQTLHFVPEAGDSRSAIVKINSGSQTQEIKVEQELVDPDPITVAEALAIIQSGNIPSSALKVTGIVCYIQEISTSYGNATYYLSDDGSFGSDNWLEVYRGFWLDGDKFTDEQAFSVGDELTIKGVLMLYGGNTPETVQGTASVVAINKSLIKVDSLDVAELPIEGGIVNAALTCKGKGISVEIPAEAQNWLSVIGIDTQNATVQFKAQPNTGGDRSTTITFKTVDGSKEYTASTTIAQTGAIIDATIAEFNAAEVGDTQYRITGVITSVANASYGNYYIKDFSGETYVYGTGEKGDFEAMGLKEGDIVTVVGKRDQYKETIEMTGSKIEEIIPVTEISVTDFLAQPDDKNVWYKVTGTITSLLGSNGKENDYGNLYISDGTSELYVYGTYPGWGATGDARKFFIADNGIEVGDEITIIGYKDTYKELVELCGGVCFSFTKPNPE